MKEYLVKCKSGYEGTVKANNAKEARVLASKMVNAPDKVTGVVLRPMEKRRGVPKKYGEQTVPMNFRVPMSQKKAVRELVAVHLQQFQEKKIETQTDVKAKKTWTLHPTQQFGPGVTSIKIVFDQPVVMGEAWLVKNEATGFHWKFKSK
jgi:hypothetical protein